MANAFVKPEVVVNAALGLLVRQTVAARLVWRDGVGDFAGAKNDTVSVRLPAYAKAKSRALRSGAERQKSSLQQRKVDVTLDTDLYLDIPVTDEQMELDIKDFGRDVIRPGTEAIARGVEDKVISTMQGASYTNTFENDLNDLKAVFAEARNLLNLANVPMEGRSALIGSDVDAAMIQIDNLVRAEQSGTTDTLREATIGRVYGFQVVTCPALLPGEIFFFHKTAYPLVTRAPKVPAGAPWGATAAFDGFSTRVVRVFDPDEVEDRTVFDSWVGAGITQDQGTIDAYGRFEPAEEPAVNGSDKKFIRAVHVTAPSTSGDDESA